MTNEKIDAPEIKPIYISAIEKVIASLYESDFRDACGWKSLKELESYKLDMALDIQRVIEEA